MNQDKKTIDLEYFKNAGKTGGQNTLKKYGKEHYARISQLAVQKKKENKNK